MLKRNGRWKKIAQASTLGKYLSIQKYKRKPEVGIKGRVMTSGENLSDHSQKGKP